MASEETPNRKRKFSRRNFVRSAGALAVAGAVGGAAVGMLGTTVAKKVEYEEGQKDRTRSIYEETSSNGNTTAQNAFSIFWITDTQFLSESNPALFRMQTNWIVENWETYVGKLVVHTGDFVQTGSSPPEWQNANEAMSILLRNNIPYVWCAGNHDDYLLDDPTSDWLGNTLTIALNPSAVSQTVNGLGSTRWAGDYHEGMNTAVSLMVGGLKFLVVAIEWDAQPDVLAWFESLLDDPNYADHHVIVAPHAYIDPYGNLHNEEWGSTLDVFTDSFTSILDAHSSNVFLTLNGHFPTDCGYNTPSMVNNRNELMFDRQDSTDEPGEASGRGADDSSGDDTQRVGGSTVTILTFLPDYNQIRVRTFDVFKNEWRKAPTEQYAIDMFPGEIATTPGLPILSLLGP